MRTVTLRTHRLTHLPHLSVDATIFEPAYSSGCSMRNCNARCCRDGVFLDPADKEKILANADLVISHMDAHQVKDPSLWFGDREHVDSDFPSGVCTETRSYEYG